MCSVSQPPTMSEGSDYAPDKEKGLTHVETAPDDSLIADRYARYGALGPVMQRLFASGVEARGIERVPESERESKNIWNKYVQPSSLWVEQN